LESMSGLSERSNTILFCGVVCAIIWQKDQLVHTWLCSAGLQEEKPTCLL
jgi:hypothetical protein